MIQGYKAIAVVDAEHDRGDRAGARRGLEAHLMAPMIETAPAQYQAAIAEDLFKDFDYDATDRIGRWLQRIASRRQQRGYLPQKRKVN